MFASETDVLTLEKGAFALDKGVVVCEKRVFALEKGLRSRRAGLSYERFCKQPVPSLSHSET